MQIPDPIVAALIAAIFLLLAQVVIHEATELRESRKMLREKGEQLVTILLNTMDELILMETEQQWNAINKGLLLAHALNQLHFPEAMKEFDEISRSMLSARAVILSGPDNNEKFALSAASDQVYSATDAAHRKVLQLVTTKAGYARWWHRYTRTKS